MRARQITSRGLLLLMLTMPAMVEAATRSALVRWAPSPSTGITSYRVYVRIAGAGFGTPRDAGLPVPAGDGTLTFTVAGLDTATTYGFAVTARTGVAESALSNEIVLAGVGVTTTTTSTLRPTTTTSSTRPRGSTSSTTSTTSTTVPGPACNNDADCADADACTENERCANGHCVLDPVQCPGADACTDAVCDPDTGCVLEPLPEGAACPTDDPCVMGACTAGTCAPPDVATQGRGRDNHFLSVSRFVIRTSGRAQRLAARASFGVSDSVDPTAAGGLLQLRSADGTVFYEAHVPGPGWRANRRRKTFRYLSSGRRAPVGANGLTRLVVQIRGAIADVSVAGSSPELAAAAREPQLAWVLQVGDQCVRDPALDCAVGATGTQCQ